MTPRLYAVYAHCCCRTHAAHARCPAGTRKDDVSVSISPQRLTVRLGWAGRVLDGPLKQRVKASEACWALGAVKVRLQEMQARLPAQQQQQLEQEQGLGVKRGVTGAGTAREGVAEGRAPVQAGASCQSEFEFEFEFVELLVVLPKEDGGHYWRALFEGGEEKSHMQVSAVLQLESGSCTLWD